MVAFADTSVLSRTYAAKNRTHVDPNQEMIGLGLANVVAVEPPVAGALVVVETAAARPDDEQVLMALTSGYGLTGAPPPGCTSKCKWSTPALPVFPT